MAKRRGTASERLKAWAEANPEKAKESVRTKRLRYIKNHPDRIRKTNIEQHKKHREKNLKRKKAWYRENPEKARERGRDQYRKNPKKAKARNLMSCYGLTTEDYQRLLDETGTICPICKKSFGMNPPCVDHDHSTGKTRGIICRQCNSGIGFFLENVDILLNAVEYLREGK